MMYALEYARQAEKCIRKLPHDARERILIALERIRPHPRRSLVCLVGSPFYRLRVGDYRIIIDLQEDRLVILVIEIGTRDEIYK